MGGRWRWGQCAAREAQRRQLLEAYARALLDADERAAERTIRDAIDAGLSTAEVDDEIIAPALWFVGERWERGEISVADEHAATEISLRVLALQREARRVAGARPAHRAVLATPAGERHDVALRMIGNLLRDAGYGVVMLGADVPATALAAAVERHEADVVCLSSTMPGGAEGVLTAIDVVQRAEPVAGFVVGGQGVTSRVRPGSDLHVCRRVPEAVEAVDAVVRRAGRN